MRENLHGIEEENVIEFASGKYIIRTEDETIRQIDKKQIVAIFQGESEIGPRALGNRSIMFDPTVPNAKDIVNEIKETLSVYKVKVESLNARMPNKKTVKVPTRSEKIL